MMMMMVMMNIIVRQEHFSRNYFRNLHGRKPEKNGAKTEFKLFNSK